MPIRRCRAGCTVVLKPSPLASLSCCALGELVSAAGAPAGALNVITGGPPQALEGLRLWRSRGFRRWWQRGAVSH